MTPAQSRERYIWLFTGAVLLVWAFAWLAYLTGALPAPVLYNVERDSAGTTIIVMLLAVGGLGLGWATYRIGVARGRKQRLVERQYRIAMEEVYRGTLAALTTALDNRDNETFAHSRRVQGYSMAIARRMGLERRQMKVLSWGALLHDLGKIGVPDQILHKPGPLTSDERAQMSQHVLIGHRMAQNVPFLTQAAAVIRYHHERYDGRGYPEGLAGEEIPLIARIFSVADAFDAMTSSRPYRPVPLELEAARQVIMQEASAQFCPRAAAVFAEIPLEELERIRLDSMLPVTDFDALAAVDEDDLELATADYYRDPLTGVKNRSAWELKQAELAGTGGRALGTVIYVAVFGLSPVSEPRGHLTEERVLRDLASRLYQIGPECYRVGNAEFLLCVPTGAWNASARQDLADSLAGFSRSWQQTSVPLEIRWNASAAGDGTASLQDLVRSASQMLISL